jgi:hypothetical protein
MASSKEFSSVGMFFEDSEQLRASQEYADVFRGDRICGGCAGDS